MFIEGELERIDEVYRRGLRHLQLFHEADDRVSPLGDVNTRAPHLGGLTAFGAEVIRACNRLGVVVDLAHASHETVIGALAASAQPLVVSHTSLDSWGSESKMYSMMKPRLITKAQAKAVADGGGVIGVWTHLTRSRADYVGSIRAMVDAIGIDHVGIGTDTDLLAARGGTNDRWPDEHGFFAGVVDEMGRQGFGAEDIAKVGGGNYVRVFEQVTSPART